jgi:hypothetical protein
MRFAVGEIALVADGTYYPQWTGKECEIIHLPRVHSWIDRSDNTLVLENRYVVEVDGHSLQATENYLCKRYLPPDWNKLSDPTNLPIEELA